MLIGLFSFFGCALKNDREIKITRKYPDWYLNPLKTTSKTLYATGEGENKQDALSDALNTMASTLSVSVASDFESKKVVKEGEQNTISSRVVSEIKSSVKKIRISGYEILNEEEAGFERYIVLIKADKIKIFDSLKNEIDQRFSLTDKQTSTLNNLNALQRVDFYKKAKANISDIPNMLSVMHVLNGSFKDSKYLDKINEIYIAYDKAIHALSFSVEAKGESKDLRSVLLGALITENFMIRDSNDKDHFTITLSMKTNKAYSYGFFLARSVIDITVKDFNGAVAGSHKLIITGQSTQGYEIAKQNVAYKFAQEIKKDKVSKIIGLNFTDR